MRSFFKVVLVFTLTVIFTCTHSSAQNRLVQKKDTKIDATTSTTYRQRDVPAKNPVTTTNKKGKKAQPISPAISTADTATIFHEKLYGRFLDFYSRGIQEKLYLQLDKPFYCASDTVWFKGYLVNAVTNTTQVRSKYIYVELIGRGDSLITRVKIKADSSGFHNAIYLDPKLPEGDYMLRGYTLWMMNNDPAFFCQKQLRIANPLDEHLTTSVAYGKLDDGRMEAVITMRNGSKPVVDKRVVCTIMTAGLRDKIRTRSDEKGRIAVPFTPILGEQSLRLEFMDEDRTRQTTFHLPDFTDDFDLQFFPEGGPLVEGVLQRVAFKAVGVNGHSKQVEGELYNRDNEIVSYINTQHCGMGKFSIMSMKGDEHYIKVRSAEGIEKRFELPAIDSAAYALKTMLRRGYVICELLSSKRMSADSLAIIALSRGKIILAQDLNPAKPVGLPIATLPPGILHLIVVDKTTNQPVSQRLMFIRDSNPVKWAITTDRPVYGRRQQVELKLNATGTNREPLPGGAYAVSVTDRNSVVWDTLAENINSCLLLTSDLKGHIEQPGYYLGEPSPERDENLDLLMMTHGWGRFEIADLLAGRLKPATFEAEDSQKISGEVRGFFGGGAKNPSLIIFSPQTRYMQMHPLSGNHRFNIVDLDFADSTTFVIQALSRTGKLGAVTLEIVPEFFPEVKSLMLPLRIDRMSKLPDKFLNQSKERYYYEGGMRVIEMEDIVVTSSPSSKPNNLIFNVEPTHSISGERLDQYMGSSLLSVIQLLPGVVASGNSISVRGSNYPPLIYVDNMQMDSSVLDQISMMEVESINLVSGPEAAIFGAGASGGVILIMLKSGVSINSTPLPSLVKVSHLGYKRPEYFYQPRYEAAEVLENMKPDVRTTIFWDPCVTMDATGSAVVKFYTADNQSIYDVILEGVSADGQVCRAMGTVVRK